MAASVDTFENVDVPMKDRTVDEDSENYKASLKSLIEVNERFDTAGHRNTIYASLSI